MNEEASISNQSGTPFQSTATPRVLLKKIIVAIHGIGSQHRSDTVRSVATRFGAREPAVALMPLGYFHIEQAGQVRVSRLDVPADDPRATIGFAEVFWADIPRKVVKEEDTLEETKAWGATVVSRAHAAYQRNVKEGELKAQDFHLVEGAVDEILETVDVLENLCAVAAKAGLFKFDLGPLLREYLGDVQLVAEFSYFRQKIVHRFNTVMEQIVTEYRKDFGKPPEELHVVAHSEGTVVSFLGILQALSGAIQDPDKPPLDPDAASQSPEWVQYLRGFMTIGSPIDKHLVLWPKMWEDVQVGSTIRPLRIGSTLQPDGSVVFPGRDSAPRFRLASRIRWRNYYDFGDPIGFRLDTAEDWLKSHGCEAFEFTIRDHDFGFSRYVLPGKAHNDYWGDDEVFGHFIDTVVSPVAPRIVERPKNKPGVGTISSAIPYVISLLCHAAAVFWLFKAITTFTDSDPPTKEASVEIAVLTLLLAGVTVAARLPRLIKPGFSTYLGAVTAFAVGAAAYCLFMPEGARERIGHVFILAGMISETAYTIGVIVLAAVPVLVGWLAPRNPRWGRRILIGSGALAVFLIVFGRLLLGTGAADDPPVWPVLLAGAAFLYLWWLGILIFDLAFMWHRYIRNSAAVENLWFWNRHVDTPRSTKERKAIRKQAPAVAARASGSSDERDRKPGSAE